MNHAGFHGTCYWPRPGTSLQEFVGSPAAFTNAGKSHVHTPVRVQYIFEALQSRQYWYQ